MLPCDGTSRRFRGGGFGCCTALIGRLAVRPGSDRHLCRTRPILPGAKRGTSTAVPEMRNTQAQKIMPGGISRLIAVSSVVPWQFAALLPARSRRCGSARRPCPDGNYHRRNLLN